MMLDIWNDISYMIELLAACMIFLFPHRSRKGFAVKMTGFIVLFTAVSYLINSNLDLTSAGVYTFAYWVAYLLAIWLFVWLGIGGSPLKAAFYAIYACAVQHIAYDIYLIYTILGGKNYIIIVLIFVAVYLLAFFFAAQKLAQDDSFILNRRYLFPIATIIILVWILSIMDDSFVSGFESGDLHRVIYRICDGLCCFYVLWVQTSQRELMRLQSELSGINAAWRLKKEQYEMTGDTIENINRKCHDLKHQIRELRNMSDDQQREAYLNELENDIMIYDTALQTGNKALDIVLMEKALYCKNHGIDWTCMADGTKLCMMKVEDIYAIFGNALENAIHAVMKLEDKMKRVVSVKIISQNSILVIQIQNYYKGKLKFENGLPVTTSRNKRDHGFGMKSIRYTAEKYSGTITVNAGDQIFTLQILIPVNEDRGEEQGAEERNEK